MAGITDLPFRTVVENISMPGLVYTEMISSRGIYYNDEKTKRLLKRGDNEQNLAAQIFGNDPKIMAQAALVASKNAEIVDINMGCPAPKIVKNGDGSKLLQNLDLAYEIMSKIVKSVECPVTVKIRKGFDSCSVVAEELAIASQEAGISMITVHGRTREEYYGGKVDLDIIKKVKEKVKIPVVGNGDINDEQSALEMFERTNVDAIMIGRGMLGNPWLIKQIRFFLETGELLPKVSVKEKEEAILSHLELEIQEKGEETGVKEMRKHIAWYIKNLKDATKLREKVNKIETREELEQAVKEYFRSNYI